jgi:biotin transporter BioY
MTLTTVPRFLGGAGGGGGFTDPAGGFVACFTIDRSSLGSAQSRPIPQLKSQTTLRPTLEGERAVPR